MEWINPDNSDLRATYSVRNEYDNPREQFAADASRAAEVIYAQTPTLASRWNAALAFLGYPWLSNSRGFHAPPPVPAGTFFFISRIRPKPYGDFNAVDPSMLTSYPTAGAPMPILWCKSIPDSHPHSVITATPPEAGPPVNPGSTEGPLWKTTLSYVSLPYMVRPDSDVLLNGVPSEGYWLAVGGETRTRHISKHTKDFSGRSITLKAGRLHFVEMPSPPAPLYFAGGAVPEGFAIPRTITQLEYTWHEVPIIAIPWQAMQQNQMGVNAPTISYVGGPAAPTSFDGYAPETLLYKSSSIKEYTSPFGVRICDLTHTFLYAPNTSFDGSLTPRGWNFLMRVFNRGGNMVLDYSPVSSDGTTGGTKPFKPVNFVNLFIPPSGFPG